jgi:TrmH family RNA methyltransferase
VVLVRPREEGNVGAVARAMANMGLTRLILVEPAVAVGEQARARARNGASILARARRATSLPAALAPFRRVVGTSSRRGRDLPAPPLSPLDLAARLAAQPWSPTALVFGPETSGLTDAELALCGEVVTIPTALAAPTLNLAQAVLLVAYELHLGRDGREAAEARHAKPAARGSAPGAEEAPATVAEIEGLFAQLEPFLAEIGFARDATFPGVLRDLRRLAARSPMTSREVAILRGICRRASLAIRRRRPPAEGPEPG